MDSSSGFASVSISRNKDFSWVFFADWLLTFFLTIALIFHFNRVVASVISWLLEIFLWRTRQVRLELQSIKFSPLGGRVFFKNLTYVDKDQTVNVIQGSLTWRYWLSAVRKTQKELLEHDYENNSLLNTKLPCRWHLELHGLEVFMYNRTVSYDNLMDQLRSDNADIKDPFKEAEFSKTSTDLSSADTVDAIHAQEAGSSTFSCLPLHIKITKGAIVAGNNSTDAVLIANFSSADGVLDTQASDNRLDLGRRSLDVSLERLNVSVKPNIMFQEKQRKAQDAKTAEPLPKKRRFAKKKWIPVRPFLKLWSLRHRRSSLSIAQSQWKGLSQYLDGDTGSVAELSEKEHEYGKYTTLLDTETCTIQYFYDIPGLVPERPLPTNPLDGIDVGNGGSAPKFGIEVKLSNSTAHIGPWAERQRGSLHQMFWPTICRDAVAQTRLSVGDSRIYTRVDFNLSIVDDFLVRVPIREFSKNEKYAEKTKDVPDTFRPFGWVELKVDTESTVSVQLAQVASNAGYANRLDASFRNLELRSSVNHDILLRCKEHVISADLGYPLSWDGHVAWSLLNESRGLEAFLLREHVTLISDMFTDFAAGAPTPYERFRPFAYDIFWKCTDYKLFFNINDANIVNNPLDFNDNIYLSFQGDEITIKLHVPMDAVVRTSTTVDYSIYTPSFSLVIDTPPWHTLNNFLADKEIGRSREFTIEGSYTYYAEVSLDLVETIVIACRGRHVALECYGFVVKYIMSIKENYFGDYVNFKTLEEYTSQLNPDLAAEESATDGGIYPDDSVGKRTENEVDVHFSFCVEDSCVILPSDIYDCDSNMALHFGALDIDIRFTNYYMDMQVDCSPAKGYYVMGATNDDVLGLEKFVPPSHEEMNIDGLSIHGHRMFGLPPAEPTCFCKWDITPGVITFDGTSAALDGLHRSILNLGFGYKNLENHLLLEEPMVFDTTHLTVQLPAVNISLCDPGISHCVKIKVSDILIGFVDFTNPRYTQKITIDVDEIKVSVVKSNGVEALFEFLTSVKVSNFCQSKDFPRSREKQNQHILRHDGPFHRVAFFVEDSLRDQYNELYGSIAPSISLPDGATPLRSETVDFLFEDMGLNDREDDTDLTGDIPAESRSAWASQSDFFQDYDAQTPASALVRGTKRPRDSIAGISAKPVLDYDDSDFKPLHAADPDLETDNFIINFGAIDVNVCSQSLMLLLGYVDRLQRGTMKSALDGLQVTVLKKLFQMFNKDPSCINLRFVSPCISFNFTETPWNTDNEIDFSDFDHTSCVVENPSLAACFKEDATGLTENIIALHVLSFKLCVKMAGAAEVPFVATLEDLEVWSSTSQNAAKSISLRSVDTSLLADSTFWLASYVERLTVVFRDFQLALESVKTRHHRARIELLYQIALASREFRVEHDPAVITRPAYIIRLSRHHIRANDSWKVIARLRHIFRNLPADWGSTQESKFAVDDFSAPLTAMTDVIEVFSNWRSWEFTDIAHSFVFRYVFAPISAPDTVPKALFEVGISESSLNVISPEGNDYLCVNFVELSGGQVNNNDANIESVPVSSLSLKVSSIKGHFGKPLLLLWPLTELKPPSVNRSTNDSHSSTLHVATLIEEIDLTLAFGKTSLAITSSDVSCTALVIPSLPGPGIDLTYGARYFEIDISSSSTSVFTYSISEFSASVASIGSISDGLKMVVVTSDKIFVRMDHKSSVYIDFLRELSQDLDRFMPLVQKLLTPSSADTFPPVDSAVPQSGFLFPPIDFVMTHKSIDWQLAIVDPLLVKGLLQNCHVEIVALGANIFSSVESAHLEQVVMLRGAEKRIFEMMHTGSSVFSKVSLDTGLLDVDWNYGKTRCRVPDLLSRAKPIRSAIDTVDSSIRSLYEEVLKLKLPRTPGQHSSSSSSSSLQTRLALNKFTFAGQLFLFDLALDSDIYSIQLEDVSLGAHDLMSDATKPYGDLSVGNMKVLIRGTDIPRFSSVVMDVNVGIKVAYNDASKDQSLQVESEFFRVMLHPSTIVKLIQLTSDVSYLTDCFGDVNLHIPAHPSSKIQGDSKPLVKFSSVHMLSYGFCVGFIFGSPTEKFPGVTLGCEKMFFIAEDNIGKFSLISAFVSMANGIDHKSFYSSGSEVDSPSRAFLPNVQIIYSIQKTGKNKDVQVRVTGEELDVKMLSSSVASIEKTLKSITAIEDMKKGLRQYPRPDVSLAAVSSEYKLPTDFTSIQCIMNFAGGTVKLYRWEDFQSDNGFAPSFELKAPAVRIATEYSKTSGLKDHNINVEVFTFSSANKLHSTCVPVLYDLWYGLKELGDLLNPGDEYDKKTTTAATESSAIDPMGILSKFHVNFALHIDRQELSLSCEPSAKVQAVVGIDGIGIRFVTNDDDPSQPLSGVVDMNRLSASLQHSYSREVSGSVGLDRVLLSLMLSSTGTSTAKMYVAGQITKVLSYVNLKQMQDLDLFRDLWFPKAYTMKSHPDGQGSGTAEVDTKDENLVLKYQKASTTSPIAWTVDFLVNDISCEVDLGQSLGVLSLDLDNIWAASRKKSGREQDLLVGLNTVALRSRGRFSGHLIVKDIRVHSVIQWSLAGDEYQIPVVLLSAGFDSIDVNASFDYNVFLLGKIRNVYVTVFNQVDPMKILQDKLVASVQGQSSELYITTFAAASILDVYNTLARIRQDTKRSYKEDLKKTIASENPEKALAIIDMIASLRTELEVNLGKFLLHVYPGSLLDTQVLVVELGGLGVSFSQRSVDSKLRSSLEMRLMDINIALSSHRTQLPEESLNGISTDDFVLHSMNARGGGIFFFPSWECSMDTDSSLNSAVIEYKFKSLFGGKVDIRWNLGSINFIREMWTIHARALAARLPKNTQDDVPLFGNENIEEKIKEVEMSDKFVYVALQPPVIDAPQLRDLGDATPPLEWFGLHRQSFPGLTHQYVIIGLQKMVHEVEMQYGRVLGKATG